MTRFACWEQTDECSCGAASLMVALNELTDLEMSDETEMSIWKTVRCPVYRGSMPGPMGRAAIKHGVKAEVLMCRSWIQRSLESLPPLEKVQYTLVLKAVNAGLWRARQAGVKVTYVEEYDDFVAHIRDRLRDHGDCRVLSAIEVADSELHWVLLRSGNHGVVSVMDPAGGDNTDYSMEHIVEMSSEVGVGCTLILSPLGDGHLSETTSTAPPTA